MTPEDESGATENGRGGTAPGEVFDHGAAEEERPVTWEIPDSLKRSKSARVGLSKGNRSEGRWGLGSRRTE